MLTSRAIVKRRHKLGPAARAVVQFGATFTRLDAGTSPFTCPASPVGRLFTSIGLAAFAVPANTIVPRTAEATARTRAGGVNERGGLARCRGHAAHSTKIAAPSHDTCTGGRGQTPGQGLRLLKFSRARPMICAWDRQAAPATGSAARPYIERPPQRCWRSARWPAARPVTPRLRMEPSFGSPS